MRVTRPVREAFPGWAFVEFPYHEIPCTTWEFGIAAKLDEAYSKVVHLIGANSATLLVEPRDAMATLMRRPVEVDIL